MISLEMWLVMLHHWTMLCSPKFNFISIDNYKSTDIVIAFIHRFLIKYISKIKCLMYLGTYFNIHKTVGWITIMVDNKLNQEDFK